MYQRLAAAFAIAIGLALAAPVSAEPLTVVSESAAVQPGFVLHSKRLGRDVLVRVDVPLATVFLPGQKFPAIYALDYGYLLAGPLGFHLGGTLAMAPAIIVSIGYLPGQEGFRNTDLTHNKFNQGSIALGGGGAAFEAFLLEDLKPFIEAKFPADPGRSVLFGHSLGGLFAANVFADKPDAFAGYIIGSASIWADGSTSQRVAAAAARAHGKRIYLAVGEMEDSNSPPDGRTKMIDGFKGLAAALKDRTNIALKTHVYAGENHVSYYPRLTTDGFQFVLPPATPMNVAAPKLTPETAKRYAGVYTMPDGRKITVKPALPANFMTAQVADLPPGNLLPNGKDRFYAPASDLNVTFDATGATLVGLDGGTLRIERERVSP